MIEQLWNDNLMWRILEQPIGWRIWILWLMTVNTAAFLFLNKLEARIIALVWIANACTMMTMYWMFGYVRLLGLSHIIWWTPLFFWLVPIMIREHKPGVYGKWLLLLAISDIASLLIDYVDVIRYFLGDTAEG